MPLVALGFVLLVLLAAVVLLPLSLFQRYRVGTARRRARGWVITLNLVALSLSVVLFVVSAAVTNLWIPGAVRYTLGGLAVGWALGLVGLALSRWEPTAGGLYYTPNALLVLGVTLVVTARVLYGFWRSWQTWQAGVEGTSLLVTFGVAESMAAGAVVLGYYLTYWIGVRRRMRRWT